MSFPMVQGPSQGEVSGPAFTLLHQWDLDEASGTRYDSVGSAHLSVVTTEPVVLPGAGVEFNDSPISALQTANLAVGPVDQEGFTIMGWVQKVDPGFTNNPFIFALQGYGSPPDGNYSMYGNLNSGGTNHQISLTSVSHTPTAYTGNYFNPGANVLLSDTFHHFAMGYDPITNTSWISVDNATPVTADLSGKNINPATTSRYLTLGGNLSAGSDTRLKRVRWYSGTVDEAERTAHFLAGHSDPVVNLPFTEATGADRVDTHGGLVFTDVNSGVELLSGGGIQTYASGDPEGTQFLQLNNHTLDLSGDFTFAGTAQGNAGSSQVFSLANSGGAPAGGTVLGMWSSGGAYIRADITDDTNTTHNTLDTGTGNIGTDVSSGFYDWAITYTASTRTCEFFINGVSINSVTIPSDLNPCTNGAILRIGSNVFGSGSGTLQKRFEFYQRVLSPAEISAL